MAALASLAPVHGPHTTSTRRVATQRRADPVSKGEWQFPEVGATFALSSRRGHTTRHRKRSPFTGYTVSGRTSTFGYLTGDSEGQTADGGTTARPCIAIRDDRTLGRWFEVEVLGHRARLLHCDWGPASVTGRAIDVTGLGDRALGFSPSAFPTGATGVARELR